MFFEAQAKGNIGIDVFVGKRREPVRTLANIDLHLSSSDVDDVDNRYRGGQIPFVQGFIDPVDTAARRLSLECRRVHRWEEYSFGLR